MATSKELGTYPPSYMDELHELLDFISSQNPHYGYAELRKITDQFRKEEQRAIGDTELRPLSAGSFKHDQIARYVPFYGGNYFIKYFTIPVFPSKSTDVQFVLLERVIRQNSGAYNSKFIKDLPVVDISES